MTRNVLTEKTIQSISRLPDDKLKEVSDFAEFLLQKMEDRMLTEGIQKIAGESKTFSFLVEDDPVTYSTNDLKESYK